MAEAAPTRSVRAHHGRPTPRGRATGCPSPPSPRRGGAQRPIVSRTSLDIASLTNTGCALTCKVTTARCALESRPFILSRAITMASANARSHTSSNPRCPRPTRFCRARFRESRAPRRRSRPKASTPRPHAALRRTPAPRVERGCRLARCAARGRARGGPDAQVHAVPPERNENKQAHRRKRRRRSPSPFANALSLARALSSPPRTRPDPRPCPSGTGLSPRRGRPRSTRSLPGLGGKSKTPKPATARRATFRRSTRRRGFRSSTARRGRRRPRSDEARRSRRPESSASSAANAAAAADPRREYRRYPSHAAQMDSRSRRETVSYAHVPGALLRIAGGRRPSGVSGACGASSVESMSAADIAVAARRRHTARRAPVRDDRLREEEGLTSATRRLAPGISCPGSRMRPRRGQRCAFVHGEPREAVGPRRRAPACGQASPRSSDALIPRSELTTRKVRIGPRILKRFSFRVGTRKGYQTKMSSAATSAARQHVDADRPRVTRAAAAGSSTHESSARDPGQFTAPASGPPPSGRSPRATEKRHGPSGLGRHVRRGVQEGAGAR